MCRHTSPEAVDPAQQCAIRVTPVLGSHGERMRSDRYTPERLACAPSGLNMARQGSGRNPDVEEGMRCVCAGAGVLLPRASW
jgi:hypothetical protein